MFSLIILLFARKIPTRLGESLELAKHKIQSYFPIEAKTKSAIARAECRVTGFNSKST